MKTTGIIVLILVIFATAVLAEVWRELHCFKITRYQIRTGKIKGDAGKVRIVFLSDLHNHVYGKENEELLLAIREAKPDLILAGGDILLGQNVKVTPDKEAVLRALTYSKEVTGSGGGQKEYHVVDMVIS